MNDQRSSGSRWKSGQTIAFKAGPIPPEGGTTSPESVPVCSSAFRRNLLLILLLALVPQVGNATGYYGPSQYLDQGTTNIEASPEFYWELEVKRMARDFHPDEKRMVAAPSPAQAEENSEKPRGDNTETADLQDFKTALATGRIKPGDPTKATEQHEAARATLAAMSLKTPDEPATTAELPEEFASEFADYHRGAFAWRLGKEHWNEARKAWNDLLNRPPEERHYRSVWAAFMLGKLAMKSGEPEAMQWFRKTRELAKEGFADSLGMAADSYGWEGRSEWKQNHPENAAPLFLTQLALGDESAVISLKALIPDRDPVEGMLNYGPEMEEREKWTDEQRRADEQKALRDLKSAAKDPLLRRLVTAHILATSESRRCSRWLGVIKETKPGKMEDAEYLGWVAYNTGDYVGAAHWLELAKADAPAALWLRARLQLRAGKLTDAAKSMAQAWESVRGLSPYTGWIKLATDSDQFDYVAESDRWPFDQAAGGDLGALRLARGDFVQALDAFRKSGLWNDAAFIAERVLTADELKAYLDQQPAPSKDLAVEDYLGKLRYLLGRRLVREDRYEEAASYLPSPWEKILQKYTAAMQRGANEKLDKRERAEAWFTAAWLARFDGMELMGTEGAPDAFAESGQFPLIDLAQQRRSGKYQQVRYEQDQEKTITRPLPLKPSKQELQRLATIRINPDVRFHYRVVAAALAIRAAKFLPDNSEELADVVNQAGEWASERDDKAANRYYNIVEQRCAKTTLGRAVLAKHWFVDESGPWSEQQQERYEAMHKELKLPEAEQ